MKPLVFLTVKTVVNGVKRALTSPQRLIGLAVVLFYYFNFIFRSFTGGRARVTEPAINPPFELPSLHVIDGIIFGLFAFLSLVLMTGSLTPRGGFRPADVDVLFPTPVSPRVVLVFRVVRDYLFTLLIPLFFALLSGRGAVAGYEFLFRNFPESGHLIGQLGLIAWLLLSLCWVCLGYGLSMFVNRSDTQSDKNKRIINFALYGSLLAAMGLIGAMLARNFSWETALTLTHHPLLRIVFFGASAATSMVMAALVGSATPAIVGAGVLIGASVLGLWLAMTQVGYMYDQAAARGFETANLQKLQRTGDTFAMLAEHARSGKVKRGRIASKVARHTVRGGAALLWKEMLLQARGALWIYYLFGPIVVFMTLAPLYGASRRGLFMVEAASLLGFLSLGMFMLVMNTANSGFMELLRRVDLQKPLPFTPAATVFWEIAAKVVPVLPILVVTGVGAVILDVDMWSVAVAALFMMPTLALVLTAVVLLVTILFPDVEDSTQRGFRGLMMMLGSAIAAGPAFLTVLLLFGFLRLSALIVAVPVVGLNVAITLGLAAIAGNLYAAFNPSE